MFCSMCASVTFLGDVCGVFVVVKCSLCEVLGVCVAIVYLFCHANVDAKYSAS